MGFPIANSNSDRDQLETLKKRSDFLRLRSGRKFRSKFFTLQAGPSEQERMRCGLTVTTKVGNAVVRNRIKRRLREVANSVLCNRGKIGFDYVLIARRDALVADYSALLDEFAAGLDHIHGNGANGIKTDH